MGPRCDRGLSDWRIQFVVALVFVTMLAKETNTKNTDGWNRGAHPMKKNDFGVWEIVVPAINGQPAIPHNSKIKARDPADEQSVYRIQLTANVADLHDEAER
jgi:hypothetical protein